MGTFVDEGRDPIDRLSKPEVFEGGLHSYEGLQVRVAYNFNGNVNLTVFGDGGASKQTALCGHIPVEKPCAHRSW